MLPQLLIIATLNSAYSIPTLYRDTQRWILAHRELRYDIDDTQKRIEILDRRVTEQLNKRLYCSGVKNIK